MLVAFFVKRKLINLHLTCPRFPLPPEKAERVKKLLDFLSAKDGISEAHPAQDAEKTIFNRKKQILNLENTAFVAQFYGFANCLCVSGKNGTVFIDTTEKMELAQEIKQDYFKQPELTNKKILGMIFTHFHADHHFGARAFFEDFIDQEVPSTSTNWTGPPIWASEHFYNSQRELDGNIRPLFMLRGARQYGFMLNAATEMIKPKDSISGKADWKSQMEYGTLMPTHTVKDSEGMKHLFDLGDVNLFGINTPGETPCHMSVWCPELKLLAIFGRDFEVKYVDFFDQTFFEYILAQNPLYR